jgi:hypothetical protein
MSGLEWSRRSFIRAVGVGAASLPFFKLLEHSAVDEQAGVMPLRFITLYHPHGCAAELWRPQGTETDFQINYDKCSLQPFDDAATYGTSFKSKLTVIEGLDLKTNANGHDSAAGILTGCDLQGRQSPGIASLDQYLAVDKGLGTTRLSSLVLGVGDNQNSLGGNLSWTSSGAISKIIDPVETYRKLFAGAVVGNDPAALAAAERKRKLGQSTVDFIRKDVARLQGRLAGPEKQKLEQHLTSLRDIEKQLAGFTAGQCTAPSEPKPSGNSTPALDFSKLQNYNGGEPYFERITTLQIELLAQAMACDITRFATLYMADLSRTKLFPSYPDDWHGGVAHLYSPSNTFGNAGKPETWATLAVQNKYSYGKCALLLRRLQEYGLLDSSLVLMSSDMGDPAAHSTSNVPTVLAGGLNGKIRMGRYIKLNPDCANNQQYCDDKGATPNPNNRLLVSIANAFGVDTSSYGVQKDPTLTQGALAQLA